jgi:hypothetical protein
MPAVSQYRAGSILPISTAFILAVDDDLNGVQNLTKSIDVTGASRVILVQERSSGADAASGVDVLVVSRDGGTTWVADDTLILGTSNDFTGTSLAGVLNAAGTEPTGSTTATSYQFAKPFKAGPWKGPAAIRITRDTTGDVATGGTDWTTGAPGVWCFVIGGNHEGGAPDTLA